MSIFLRIVGILANYGKRAVDWAWRNKDLILNWIRDGLAIDAIISRIRQLLGI